MLVFSWQKTSIFSSSISHYRWYRWSRFWIHCSIEYSFFFKYRYLSINRFSATAYMWYLKNSMHLNPGCTYPSPHTCLMNAKVQPRDECLYTSLQCYCAGLLKMAQVHEVCVIVKALCLDCLCFVFPGKSLQISMLNCKSLFWLIGQMGLGVQISLSWVLYLVT